jgi:hypothetical protein
VSTQARRWLIDYTSHLRAGAGSFAELGLSPEFLTACQEFDSTLRGLDAGALQAAASASDGERLVAELSEARAAFEAAASQAREELLEARDGLRHGARTLRGYEEAGTRGGPDARFLTRRG